MAYINIIKTLLNHPIHPVLVHFPIGLTGGAVFFIVIALIWNRQKVLEKIAFANLALSVPAVIAAMTMGIADNINRYAGKAANHTYKIVFASILLVVVAATSYARWQNQNLFEQKNTKYLYVAAFFVAFIIALILGFLGGVIVFGSS